MVRRLGDAPFDAVVWLLPVAYTIHDLEEWIWQPTWAPEGFSSPVGAFAFRFALLVVTVGVWAITWLAARGRSGGIAAHLAVAAAGVLLLNVVFPHLIAAIWFRGYAPGVVTAVLVNLWVAPLVFRAAIRSRVVSVRGGVGATALVCIALLPLLVGLLWLGGVLETVWNQGAA